MPDEETAAWSGVVPFRVVAGDPEPAPWSVEAGTPVPASVTTLVKRWDRESAPVTGCRPRTVAVPDRTGAGHRHRVVAGISVREAVRTVRDLLVDGEGGGLPHLPDTPARGPGADIIGRAAGLLVELPVDLQPSGWRFVDRPGLDASRTASMHREDLDELAEAYDGYEGALKVQVAGPWTLAASLRLNRGERVVADPGAVADLVASLTDGIRAYVADVRRLVPGAQVVLQLDEPSLPAVLEGSLPTSSGFGRVRAVDPTDVMRGVEAVLAGHDGDTVVHCCHPSAPLPLLRATGAGRSRST